MLDGRRHSVDVPLSKTLVALRRVKSLRDPSTNSMSKFSAFVDDNLNWEMDYCNGISLGLRNGYEESGLENQSPLGSHNFCLDAKRGEFASDPEMDCTSSIPDSKSISSKKLARVGKRGSKYMRTKCVKVAGHSRLNEDGVYGNKSFGAIHDHDHGGKALDLACLPPSSKHLEEVESCGKPASLPCRSGKNDSSMKKQKSRFVKQIKSSGADGGFVGNHIGSPFTSVSDGQLDESSRSTSVFANEEADIVDSIHQGCGISCCWSRTPRSRESDLPSDVEDHPLLSGEGGEMGLCEQEQNCTYIKSEIAPYSESPRSLSHKFRPRSFDELVGQHVVACSLLNAISKGKIASLYLFHGPRGTGKTSTARIFAAALNCLSLDERKPCGLCRECTLFFSGRNRDVKEVDPMRANQTDRFRSLLKNAARPPGSSRFKVFIIDECQLLRGETWASVLNSLDDLPRYVVFVMITADLDNLPRSALSRCLRYHFPKVKDVDIVNRLIKICIEESLEFDKVALDFIAAKSNGSLRDAEMILDQLSLLGKRITMSLAFELIGIVSDEELLDLLDLALSSDTPNTVRRARELMRSRVDPMQLISQLANLIMDILAGRCQTVTSEVGGSYFGRHTSEADLQKLRHALKILSETEKQLRSSKNQTTWLTVALLQLSSVESSSLDARVSREYLRKQRGTCDRFCSTSLTGENLNHSVSCLCAENNSQHLDLHSDGRGNLETIWKGAIERCQSSTIRSFLRKEGKLSSVRINNGLAVVEVEFGHPNHVSRAEKSWKVIASSLQFVLGCNIEIRINLVPCTSARKNAKLKKPSFCLLSCSRRMHSTTEDENNESGNSVFTFGRAVRKEKPVESYSSDHGSQFPPICSHCKEVSTTIRNEGNALITEETMLHRAIQDDATNGSQLGVDSSEVEDVNQISQLLSIQEAKYQPSCFSKTLRFHRRLHSSDASDTICLRIQPHNKLEFSIPRKPSFESYFCSNDPYILYSSSSRLSFGSQDEKGSGEEYGVNPMAHCWRAPKFPIRKAWQLRQRHRRCQFLGWVLPCATVK